jgi:hypothetical protein
MRGRVGYQRPTALGRDRLACNVREVFVETLWRLFRWNETICPQAALVELCWKLGDGVKKAA